MTPQDLHVLLTRHVDVVVCRLEGVLSESSVAAVHKAVTKALHDTSQVIVDLTGLVLAWTPAVQVFPAVLAGAGGWPSARLVLFGAGEALTDALGSVGVAQWVPVAEDETRARFALRARPTHVRREVDLPADPVAPRIARSLVRDACVAWDIDDEVCEDAVLVATELAANAVDHARTTSRLTVTLHDDDLRVAVRDCCPGGDPRAAAVDVTAARGRGLLVVQAVSRSWGVSTEPDGKTVWSVLSATETVPTTQPDAQPDAQPDGMSPAAV